MYNMAEDNNRRQLALATIGAKPTVCSALSQACSW
jgi:hypothetical protein